MDKLIEPRQIRAARTLLGWNQDDLSEHSKISKATICRLEKRDTFDKNAYKTVSSILSALQNHGIKFINENGFVGITLKI